MAAAESASSVQSAPQDQDQGQWAPPASPAPPSQLGGPAGGSSRHEKSLGLLTAKFVSLLQEAQDGVLDLKAVSALRLRGGNWGRGRGSATGAQGGAGERGVGAWAQARGRGRGAGEGGGGRGKGAGG